MLPIFGIKSDNLFEPYSRVKRVVRLDIAFPSFDIAKQGAAFLNFENLRRLDVQSDVTSMSLLPEEIGQLHLLSELNILNFSYSDFPLWITNLPRLKKLMIRGNDVKTIPDEIRRLSNLRKLRIENCALTELNRSVSKLHNLRELSLVDNFKITKLSPDCLPKKLRVLNVSASSLCNKDLSNIQYTLPKLKIYGQ